MRTRRDDPYFDVKVYHYAAKVREDGVVSALCYARPRPINLARGQSWTLLAAQVTCSRCRRKLRDMVVGGEAA